MEESLAQTYYDRLLIEPNSASLLTQMYCTYFGINLDHELVQTFGRLIKIYGKEISFYTILEIFNWNLDDAKKPRGALFHIARKLFEETHKEYESTDLTKNIESMLAKVNRIRKPNVSKINDPFEEEESTDARKPGIISD